MLFEVEEILFVDINISERLKNSYFVVNNIQH